jgi:hypothetical protein
MARNESIALLHAILDFRRIIEVPGYGRIPLKDATRFIATMNEDIIHLRISGNVERSEIFTD